MLIRGTVFITFLKLQLLQQVGNHKTNSLAKSHLTLDLIIDFLGHSHIVETTLNSQTSPNSTEL